MAIEERDLASGYLTTGHEWNGIKELNTPVPRPVAGLAAGPVVAIPQVGGLHNRYERRAA